MGMERQPQPQFDPDSVPPYVWPEAPIMDPKEKDETKREAKDKGYDDDGYSKPSDDDEGYRRFEAPEGTIGKA